MTVRSTLLFDGERLAPEADSAMLEAIAPQALDGFHRQALRQRILARAGADADRSIRTVRADEGEWKVLLPRVKIKVLRDGPDAQSYLLRLEPGAVLPPHHHPADEECVVLEGEVRLGEVVARAGDYHLAPRGRTHDPIVSETGALLFLRGAAPSVSQVNWHRLGRYLAAGIASLQQGRRCE